MTTYDRSTGTAGTLRQIITYSTNQANRTVTFNVEFWILCSDPATHVASLPWTGTVAGTDVSGSVALSSGFGSRKLAEYTVTRAVQADGTLSTTNRTFVLAIPSSGTSGLGGPTTFSVAVSVPRIEYSSPGVPGNPRSSSSSPGQAVLTWDVPSGRVTGYGINYWINHVLTYVTQAGTSRTINASPGDQVDFDVYAYNEDNRSDWSALVSITTDAAAPSVPQSLVLNPDSSIGTGFKASWSAPSSNGGKPITSYDLQYRKVGAASWVLAAGVSSGAVIGNLISGASYEAQVRAKNVDATGPWTASSTVVVPGSQPAAPAAPTLSAISTGVRVTFTDPLNTGGKPITVRDLQYRVDNGAWVYLPGITLPRDITGLSQGSVIDVQARVSNADRTSNWSASTRAIVGGASAGQIWTGTAWATPVRKVWDGSSFVVPIKKVWNGTSWVNQL